MIRGGDGRPCPITGRPRVLRNGGRNRLRTGVLWHVSGPYMSGRSTGPEPLCWALCRLALSLHVQLCSMRVCARPGQTLDCA